MLRKNQLGLQVNVEGEWKWVFCYVPAKGIITTENYKKALPASDFGYFSNRFSGHEFRVCKAKDTELTGGGM